MKYARRLSERRGGRPRRRLPRLAAAAGVAGLFAAVTAPMPGSAAVSRPAGPPVPQLAGPPVPALAWRACDGGFQCATARVPLDYRHPRGTSINIAVIRHLATGPARRVGTLFVNSGGPAEQIEPFPAGFGLLPAALRARFDVVTFDPRGFGFSTAVRCFPSMAAENKFLAALPPFPVGAAQDSVWERTYASFDARCATRGGDLLAHDSTADVARDMDLLRQAVGAPTVNYLGLSYGTGLAAVYANLFPARVGRMVLDGNLDPVAWTSRGGLPSSMRLHQDTATAATMRDFLNLCGKSSTAACAFSAGTPARTRARWHTLLRRLLAHPVMVGGQTFTYAGTVTDVPLGNVDQWQAAAGLLQQLWAASAAAGHPVTGGQSPATGPQGSTRRVNAAAAGSAYTGLEQTLAVSCSDNADPRGTRDYQAAARQARARAGGFGLFWVWHDEPCADWPRVAGQDRYAGPWNRRTAGTVLVIGNSGDPATPYRDAVAMSHDLARARLLTVDGFGHTEFFNPSTCATNDEIRYLTTGALPAAGTVCQQNGTPFPVASRQDQTPVPAR
jgi:pimeloyl-ACP methyl ester carboxylesterase